MRPTPGTVYVSATDPSIRLTIEHATDPEPDGFFLVEVDDGKMNIELTADEWGHWVNEIRLMALP